MTSLSALTNPQDIITLEHSDWLDELPDQLFTPTGLTLPEDTSFEDWVAIGRHLQWINKAIHWWIGDWIRFGERKWGETYAQAIEETPFAYQTLANDVWVASAIEPSRRRENLPFSYHAVVAALPPPEQDALLNQAEKESWTRARLWEEAHSYQKSTPIPPPPSILYSGPATLCWDRKTSLWQLHLPPGVSLDASAGDRLRITIETP